MGLAELPNEVRRHAYQIVWRIFIMARCAALPMVCRMLYEKCTHAPSHVRCTFLLCAWLDSYALRFTRGVRADAGIPALAPMFIPTTFPPSGAHIPQRRAATSDMLSYMARFPLCTPALLGTLERFLLRTRMCGNVCQLYGLFPWHVPRLHPEHLACHTVPERLVRTMAVYRLEDEIGAEPPILHALLAEMMSLFYDTVPTAYRLLPVVRPSLQHTELLLRLVLMHRAISASSHAFLLLTAVAQSSLPMLTFLLARDADPTAKNSLALLLAAKQGWLIGLRLLVERDEQLEAQWRRQTARMTEIVHSLAALRTYGAATLESRGVRPLPARTKRRRLEDRCTLRPEHLEAAVRAKAWDVVAYMMHAKGVVPDVQTLQWMEQQAAP